jgi:hypothetical protein
MHLAAHQAKQLAIMAGLKSTVPDNPLIDGDLILGTINRCRCAMQWMSNVSEPDGMHEDLVFGRHLLASAITDALKHVEAQLDAKPRLSVASG